MVLWTLVFMGAASLIAAALFAAIAAHVGQRDVRPDLRLANVAFVLAWAGFALQAATDGARTLLSATGSPDPQVYFMFARVKILVASVAIWGFGVYVACLWAGRPSLWAWLLAPFAAAHGLLFSVLFEERVPTGVRVETWAPRLEFAVSGALPDAVGLVAFAAFFLPPILIAAVYLSLALRLGDRAQKFRIVGTAVAILVFHVVAFFQFDPDRSGASPIFPALAVLTVVAAFSAFLAFWPPAVVRRALRLDAWPGT